MKPSPEQEKSFDEQRQLHRTKKPLGHTEITTGWMNPFFEKTRIFVRIEELVRNYCPGGTARG